MSEQVEPTGNEPVSSGDPVFDEALAEAAGTATPEPVTPEPEAAPEPAANPDFTFVTLENGEREMRLATGQIYKGKDDAEIMSKVAAAQVEASRHITQLNNKIKEVPTPTPPAQTTTPAPIDPTALAIADLMAPAFGVKDGKELVAAFAAQQETAQRQQEFMVAQAANMEAANFFRAVPEFSKSQADADKIDHFLQENQLPFNAKTAEMAYYTLKAKGEFPQAATPAAPTTRRNNMPAPPVGTAPASTGKGAATTTDLWQMSPEDLEKLMDSYAA